MLGLEFIFVEYLQKWEPFSQGIREGRDLVGREVGSVAATEEF